MNSPFRHRACFTRGQLKMFWVTRFKDVQMGIQIFHSWAHVTGQPWWQQRPGATTEESKNMTGCQNGYEDAVVRIKEEEVDKAVEMGDTVEQEEPTI